MNNLTGDRNMAFFTPGVCWDRKVSRTTQILLILCPSVVGSEEPGTRRKQVPFYLCVWLDVKSLTRVEVGYSAAGYVLTTARGASPAGDMKPVRRLPANTGPKFLNLYRTFFFYFSSRRTSTSKKDMSRLKYSWNYTPSKWSYCFSPGIASLGWSRRSFVCMLFYISS